MSDETRRTIASYDEIATAYADFWSDRRVVERPLTMFASLLPHQALVLDAGCGPGFDSTLLRERGLRVVGLDRSVAMLQLGRARYPGPYVQGDLLGLPFAPWVLHGIWASATLLHLPRHDFAPVLTEFMRVLAPGGLLYLSLKEGEGEEWRTDACGHEAPRFFTYWQPEALDAALSGAGFAMIASWRESGRTATWLNRIVHI
ncbi:MAG: class I SAM-dependent methyltransferase [Anaerolineae bacterium]|nr:class I SAM-dependent methyltransferase [Anaerolineae bacterium]